MSERQPTGTGRMAARNDAEGNIYIQTTRSVIREETDINPGDNPSRVLEQEPIV
jgi:hypothetical protein